MTTRPVLYQELTKSWISRDSEVPIVESICETVPELSPTVLQCLASFGADENNR